MANEREKMTRQTGHKVRTRGPGEMRGLSSMAGGLLIVMATLATGGWLILNRWYSISRNWDTEFFAFEKIRGVDGAPVLSPELRWTAVIFLLFGLLYAIGWRLIAHLREITLSAKIGIVLAGLGPGLVNVSLFPVGALDIFRYMRALKQFLYYDENPYLVGFSSHKEDPFLVHGFLLGLPNAKGPAWLLLSSIPAKLAGFDEPIRMIVTLKLYNLLLIGLTAWLASQFFTAPAHRWLAFFAVWANPLMLFEGVGNAHNDVMIALFTVAALLALKRGSWLALPALTFSVLVKYFTLQLGPLFLLVMFARKWRWRTVAVSIAGSLVVAAICILPFWSDGKMVDGIGDVGDAYNHSSHVSIISLVRQYRIRGLTQTEARPFGSHQLLFAGICAVAALPFLWRARRGKHVEQTAIDLTLLFLLLLSLLYPWYLITVIALLALRRNRFDAGYLFIATTLGLLYYPAYVWAWHGSGYDRLTRHLFLAMFLTMPIFAYWLVRFGAWVRR